MFKERFKFIIDTMDSITKDPNVSTADRLKSESIKLEALSMLQNTIEASISSPDPHSALRKSFDRAATDNDKVRVAIGDWQHLILYFEFCY
jgi:hypothetical protein